MKSLRKLIGVSVVLLGLFASLRSAEGQYRGNPNYFLERVARVQYISGEVSQAPSGCKDWAAVAMNQPLKPTVCIWSDKNSRAELNVMGGFIRLNSETSVTLAVLNESTVQFRVNQGTVSLTVQHLRDGEIYEIDTPNATLTVMKPGVYRVDVYPNEDQTRVTTRRGSLTATGQGKAVKVNGGEQVRFRAGDSMQHTSEKAPPTDGFDDWANVRDQRLGSSRPVPFGIVVRGGPLPFGPVGIPGPVRPAWVLSPR